MAQKTGSKTDTLENIRGFDKPQGTAYRGGEAPYQIAIRKGAREYSDWDESPERLRLKEILRYLIETSQARAGGQPFHSLGGASPGWLQVEPRSVGRRNFLLDMLRDGEEERQAAIMRQLLGSWQR